MIHLVELDEGDYDRIVAVLQGPEDANLEELAAQFKVEFRTKHGIRSDDYMDKAAYDRLKDTYMVARWLNGGDENYGFLCPGCEDYRNLFYAWLVEHHGFELLSYTTHVVYF